MHSSLWIHLWPFVCLYYCVAGQVQHTKQKTLLQFVYIINALFEKLNFQKLF